MDAALQVLLDKQEINEVVVRFFRGLDRGQPDVAWACYHPDAIEDHGGLFRGPVTEWAEAIQSWVTDQKTRQTHCVSNVLVDVDGDRAVAEYLVTTTGITLTSDGAHGASVGCRIVDRFERRDTAWLVSHRELFFEWSSPTVVDETWPGLSFAAAGIPLITYNGDPDTLKRSGKPDESLRVALAELQAEPAGG